jgi:glutamate racemase
MANRHDAIGVFDSGVGGLTVVRQIESRLPNESVIYLGDTARVPYGTKSPETVVRYGESCARLLLERDIKMLVVACNTASAFALDILRERLDIPVLGVIEPGAQAALRASRSGRVGVVGTTGTIESGRYRETIHAQSPDTMVLVQACPLFVPLAEEGWTTGDVPRRVAETYLAPMLSEGIDTLVLGCTHYPLLREVIGEVVGEAVTLVDSAEETAKVVQESLEAMDLCCEHALIPQFRFLVSDAPASFEKVGQRFLGHIMGDVEWVEF